MSIEIQRGDSQFELVEQYTSASFWIEGWPTWLHALFVGFVSIVSLAMFSVCMAVCSTKYKFIRSIVLHPSWSVVAGLVVGKYLITDFLLRNVKPIRLAGQSHVELVS